MKNEEKMQSVNKKREYFKSLRIFSVFIPSIMYILSNTP